MIVSQAIIFHAYAEHRPQDSGYERFDDNCRIARWTVILLGTMCGGMVLGICFMAWCKDQRRRRQLADDLSRRSAMLRTLQLEVSNSEPDQAASGV